MKSSIQNVLMLIVPIVVLSIALELALPLFGISEPDNTIAIRAVY